MLVLLYVFVLSFPVEVQHFDRLRKKIAFHFLIQRAVSLETRRLIYLYQPWFGLLVEEDVHAKDLETKLILDVLGLCSPIDMYELVVSGNNSLDAEFLELVPALLR